MQKHRYHPPCGKHRWDLFLFIHTPANLRHQNSLKPIPEECCFVCQQYTGERDHKCNPANPYEICSLQGKCIENVSGGPYTDENGNKISEAEQNERRERCRKQWQLSQENLKTIANSYPKVTNTSASSVGSTREGRSRHRRKLPPIERPETDGDGRFLKANNRGDYSALESSASHKLESQAHRSSTHVDKSVREDQSLSCEPEWIVAKPQKVRPQDNLKLEGQMDLETTFRSTIDSSAQQLLSSSRQGLSPIDAPQSAPEALVPLKRRHRPKTSLKLGGEGSYSTINKESYKNFVIVDQISREELVQERLTAALAESTDETALMAKNAFRTGHKIKERRHNPRENKTHFNEMVEIRENEGEGKLKSRSKRETDQKSSKTNEVTRKTHQEPIKSNKKASTDNKSEISSQSRDQFPARSRSEVDQRGQRSEVRPNIANNISNDLKSEKNQAINSNENLEKTKLSESKSKAQQSHGTMTDNKLKTMSERSSAESSTESSEMREMIVTSETTKKQNKSRDQSLANPPPPPPVTSIRPNPIRPTSSLTVGGKFKEDVVVEAVTTQRKHFINYEEQLKKERERLTKSKSNPALDQFGKIRGAAGLESQPDSRSSDSSQKRGQSLPRNKLGRYKNESQLRFDGNMEFVTTNAYFQNNSDMNDYMRENRPSENRRQHRDLFRASSETEIQVKPAFDQKTTYNSVFRNKLYCPAIDLTKKNSDYEYKGEAGGHHFFLPVNHF